MTVIGIDVGATKIALARFSEEGEILERASADVAGRVNEEVGALIRDRLETLLRSSASDADRVRAVGIAVPGIYHPARGRVWAPNIPGWEDYPLLQEIKGCLDDGVTVSIDSDRAACILGEAWRGTARGSQNAVFIAVGTGIGAGILVDGRVLRGQRDIAGAIGWLALDRPYRSGFERYGCFEYQASGPGLVRLVGELVRNDPSYTGHLRDGDTTTSGVFAAYDAGDRIAIDVIDNAVHLWGMAAANLVSLFDPEVVVFGGGVFGPAAHFIDRIREEALRWGQPISTPQVRFGVSALAGDTGLYGAGHLALRALTRPL